MQCPDCDAVRIFSDPPEGDGRCSACHGSGFGEFFESAIVEFFNGKDSPACEKCYGSGRCQTCMGTGITKEPEVKIAA